MLKLHTNLIVHCRRKNQFTETESVANIKLLNEASQVEVLGYFSKKPNISLREIAAVTRISLGSWEVSQFLKKKFQITFFRCFGNSIKIHGCQDIEGGKF